MGLLSVCGLTSVTRVVHSLSCMHRTIFDVKELSSSRVTGSQNARRAPSIVTIWTGSPRRTLKGGVVRLRLNIARGIIHRHIPIPTTTVHQWLLLTVDGLQAQELYQTLSLIPSPVLLARCYRETSSPLPNPKRVTSSAPSRSCSSSSRRPRSAPKHHP